MKNKGLPQLSLGDFPPMPLVKKPKSSLDLDLSLLTRLVRVRGRKTWFFRLLSLVEGNYQVQMQAFESKDIICFNNSDLVVVLKEAYEKCLVGV